MSNFHWETEEETAAWEEALEVEEPRPGRRRLILILILFLVILLSAGSIYIVYQQINRRVAEAVSSTETAVLTSHELMIDAATEGDRELFINLLSGRDAQWTQGYLRLIEGNILFNRPHMGLQTANIRARQPTIQLTPDLTEATITRTVTYIQTSTDTPIELQHVSVYRQGAERWLLSPLEATNSAWQIMGGYDGRFITADFREPDAALALRIARDLEQTVEAICSGFFDVTCPPELHYSIDFSIDPNTLFDMTLAAQNPPLRETDTINPSRSFTLPTPTLVGLPVDETGYQLLYAGYARIVAQELLTESARNYWADLPEVQPYSVQHHLGTLGLDFTPPLTRTAASPPPPLPQDIVALCMADEGLELMSYDPTAETLTTLLPGRVFTALEAAPDDKIIALEERFTAGGNSASRVVMWAPTREDTFIVAELPRDSIDNLQWREHPEQRRLFIIDEQTTSNERSIESITFNDQCLTDECLIRQDQSLFNDIYWSKDGQYTLVDVRELGVFLGNEAGQPLIFLSAGSQPFWIDEFTYGFLLNSSTAGGTIFTGYLDQSPIRPLITQDELAAALPQEIQTENLFIPYTNTNGDTEEQLLVLVLSRDQLGNLGSAYVLLYDRPTDTLRTVIYSDQMHSFSTSPDGRYLQATIYDRTAGQQTIHLVDLQQEQDPQIFPLYGVQEGVEVEWSQNGEWMLALTDGYLHLINITDNSYYQHLPGGTPSCLHATWIEPAP